MLGRGGPAYHHEGAPSKPVLLGWGFSSEHHRRCDLIRPGAPAKRSRDTRNRKSGCRVPHPSFFCLGGDFLPSILPLRAGLQGGWGNLSFN
jgi:hypothetical protein